MSAQSLVHSAIDNLVVFATDILIPVMLGAFLLAAMFRLLIYYTIKRYDWFSREFEKRVGRYLETRAHDESRSFYVMLKKVLEKTFYEIFEIRSRLKRRKPDPVMSLGDRLFMIRQGTAWVVRDTLKRAKFLRHSEHQPRLHQIAKSIFENNPCFNRLFGIIPSSGINDVLNILPGIFIIGGIFGTFLGIMEALPELGGMDLTDVDQTKYVMDQFLLKISFAMSTSLIGIMLSVVMSFLNTVMSPERLYVSIIDRFENSLDILWHLSDSNQLPSGIAEFEEQKDPLEALAENTVHQEVEKGVRGREYDAPEKKKGGQDAS